MLGISLEKITSSPLFVTSHPITEVESFFVRELLERIRGPSYLPCDLSGDSSPNINTAPTPSPNNAVPIRLLMRRSSFCKVRLVSSQPMTSAVFVGCAFNQSSPLDRPIAPPAHPNPHSGMRYTSSLKGRSFIR